MIVGEPPGLISAMLLPATSVVPRSAKLDASSRHTRPAGPSKPDGAGVSSNLFRNASDDGLSMRFGEDGRKWRAASDRRLDSVRLCGASNGEDDERQTE